MSLTSTANKLACPIDGETLTPLDGALQCTQGHSFDIAASGYVNLLPVQLKASKDPGDSKQMVQARRRVLEAGLYTPLANSVAAVVTQCLLARDDKHHYILDAGCGEGFYTNHLIQSARAAIAEATIEMIGVDISKWAIQSAAKRYTDTAWVVGNNKQLPIARGCASVITSIFGFEMWQAWHELQQEGQFVITIDAGPRHLIELRELIYDNVKIHDAPASSGAEAVGYELTERLNISFESEVADLSLLQDVLAMTPHGYRSHTKDLAAAKITFPMAMTVDAVMRTYRRS